MKEWFVEARFVVAKLALGDFQFLPDGFAVGVVAACDAVEGVQDGAGDWTTLPNRWVLCRRKPLHQMGAEIGFEKLLRGRRMTTEGGHRCFQ